MGGHRNASRCDDYPSSIATPSRHALTTSSTRCVHLRSSRFAVDTRHEQSVVVGVDMADGGDDGQAYSVGVQRPARGASSDTAAAACRGVKCDRLGAVVRTTRELLADRGGELTAEAHVLIGPAALLAFPATGAHVGVGEALLCGLFDRGRLRQNALPLIAIAPCAPAHHDGGQSAGLRGAPGERGVAGRQKLEVAEVGAVQTQCTRLVLEKEVAGVAAGCARPRVVRRDHDDPSGTAWALDYRIRHVG